MIAIQIWKNNQAQAGCSQRCGRMHGRVRGKELRDFVECLGVLCTFWIPAGRQGDFVVRMVVLGWEAEIDTKFK